MNDNDYENSDERKYETIRKIGIAILIVIAIIIIILLLKGCSKRNNPVNPTPAQNDLTKILLEAGKEYYEKNIYESPKVIGECSEVKLNTLMVQNLLNGNLFHACNSNTTYVKVCKLESGKNQYVPFLNCKNEVTEDSYGKWKEGEEKDVVADVTDVRFLFQASYLDTTNSNLGDVKEYWEGEIPFKNYKVVGTTTYYRYRDLEYIWNIKSPSYYPNNFSDSSKVKEYYIASPASGYTNKSDENSSVSKYYKSISKSYWVDSEGTKKYSTVAPDNVYIYKDNPISETRYSSRTWTETSKPVETSPARIYICSSASDTREVTSSVPCDQNTDNPTHTITVKMIYSCDGGFTEVKENDKCYKCTDGSGLKTTKDSCGSYGAWSSWVSTVCDTKKSDVCRSATITVYSWYKENREYYPSKSSSASGEKTYYASAPAEGLLKDESTTTKGWKWYKEVQGTTSDYKAVAPQSTATKTSTSRWSEYTNWSTNKPASIAHLGGTREIQTKKKYKVREILNVKSEEWKVFNEDYISLEELIEKLKAKGYNVENLQDISASGELQYKVKLLIRNKEMTENGK